MKEDDVLAVIEGQAKKTTAAVKSKIVKTKAKEKPKDKKKKK
jgi:hypothetical protein